MTILRVRYIWQVGTLRQLFLYHKIYLILLYLKFGTFVSLVYSFQQFSGGWTEAGHFFLFTFSVSSPQIQQKGTRVWGFHKGFLHILYNTTEATERRKHTTLVSMLIRLHLTYLSLCTSTMHEYKCVQHKEFNRVKSYELDKQRQFESL